MDSQRTAAIVKAWYESIGRGDFEAVLNGLAEDVVFELPVDQYNKIVPCLGVHRGRAAVAEAFRIRGETTEVLQYETRMVRAQDNDAFTVVYTKARCRQTGAEFEIEDVHRQKLNEDGKII